MAISIERANTIDKLSRSEAARESHRLRSVLLDSVPHEFRTPLTSIKAAAETLLSEVELDKPQRKDLLQGINEESDRLNRLVGDAGEVAELDSHQLQFSFETHPTRDAIDAGIMNSQQALRRHPLECTVPESVLRCGWMWPELQRSLSTLSTMPRSTLRRILEFTSRPNYETQRSLPALQIMVLVSTKWNKK